MADMDVRETMKPALAHGAEKIRLVRIVGGVGSDVEDAVVKEAPLTILLDNQELVTMLCLPVDLKDLAVGLPLLRGVLEEPGRDQEGDGGRPEGHSVGGDDGWQRG